MLLSWDKLTAMEGDELTVHLLPSQCSLLIRLLWYIEDNPQYFEDSEGFEELIQDYLDDCEGRLSSGVE